MSRCDPINGPLNADNDMVGAGALGAFFATATITFFTVIYSYVSDSLDSQLLNPLDERVVHFTKRAMETIKLEPQARQHTANSSGIDPGRVSRQKAINDFLMSLSDQQLVTGLAILIAAVAGRSSLSAYEFTIAQGLGWFSCTTHLATLDILCIRFQRHGILRDIRVLGILGIMALLSYVTILSSRFPSDYTTPIDCADESQTDYFLVIISLLPIWLDYVNAIQKLYVGPRLTLFDMSKIVKEMLKAEPISNRQLLINLKTQNQSKRIEGMISNSAKKPPTRLCFDYYDGSFLESFPDMTYSFTFGVTQIVSYRWFLAPKLSEDSTSMGYGQITTVILLILPFLSIGEAYSEYRKSRHYGTTQSRVPTEDHRSVLLTPLTSVHGMLHDLSPVEFERQLPTISKYFPIEVYELSRLQDASTVEEKRNNLLQRTTLVITAERNFTPAPTIAIFLLHSLSSVLGGVFLNIDSLSAVGSCFNLINLVLGNWNWVRNLITRCGQVKKSWFCKRDAVASVSEDAQ